MAPLIRRWRTWLSAAILLLVASLVWWGVQRLAHLPKRAYLPLPPELVWPSPWLLVSLPLADRWDFPLGSEHGAFVYNAQPFTENRHLGDDLNGIGGKNTDFGDPVYSAAKGRVWYVGDGGPGWGNVLLLLHAVPKPDGGRQYVVSFYGHLDAWFVDEGEIVPRGKVIGTVGDAGGRYWAHLHFEIRKGLGATAGPGYRDVPDGWLSPADFIREHRGAPDEDLQPDLGLPRLRDFWQ